MVEDTNDGAFYSVPPLGGSHIRPNSGPVGIGLFSYSPSEQSLAVRERADAAIRRLVERRGLGRFLKLTETPGVYASHPLGGCRMADSKGLGVLDHRCEVFGYEGLFCMDSSAIPTSLGVNPSLTISAVCERAAASLVGRADDFGLPRPPRELRHRPPGVHLGPRRHP
jgi:enediyne biosynthesis protein E9